MLKKLEEIATITSGVYEKVHPSGDAFYLQGKHFDDRGKMRDDMVFYPELLIDNRIKRHLLQDGDILLISKGESNKACLYQKQIGEAVASSTFLVIRIKENVLLPEFLQWYFNTTYVQEVLAGLSKGTQISSLSKGTLSDILIPVPTLKKQKETLEIQRLWNREKSLTLELLNLKNTNYQNLLLNKISK